MTNAQLFIVVWFSQGFLLDMFMLYWHRKYKVQQKQTEMFIALFLWPVVYWLFIKNYLRHYIFVRKCRSKAATLLRLHEIYAQQDPPSEYTLYMMLAITTNMRALRVEIAEYHRELTKYNPLLKGMTDDLFEETSPREEGGAEDEI